MVRWKYRILQTGDTIGCLTLIKRLVEIDVCGQKRGYWECKCQCGNIIKRSASNLRDRRDSGITNISCGCVSVYISGPKNPNWKGYGEISSHDFGGIKRSAIKRSIYFDITIQYAWNLFLEQDRKCVLSKVTLQMFQTKDIEKTASLDRIDSKIGYIEGNVQWVHKDINNMKWDLPQEKFIDWCKKVADSN